MNCELHPATQHTAFSQLEEGEAFLYENEGDPDLQDVCCKLNEEYVRENIKGHLGSNAVRLHDGALISFNQDCPVLPLKCRGFFRPS